MEMDDHNTQQVWQRVFAHQEETAVSQLRGLLLAAGELAGNYRYLMGTLNGRSRELARALYEGQLEIVACLKGISVLSHQGEEALTLWTPEKSPAKKLLESCYHRTRRCMVDYSARSAEPEFGTVFLRLAELAGRSCILITRLLGTLP